MLTGSPRSGKTSFGHFLTHMMPLSKPPMETTKCTMFKSSNLIVLDYWPYREYPEEKSNWCPTTVDAAFAGGIAPGQGYTLVEWGKGIFRTGSGTKPQVCLLALTAANLASFDEGLLRFIKHSMSTSRPVKFFFLIPIQATPGQELTGAMVSQRLAELSAQCDAVGLHLPIFVAINDDSFLARLCALHCLIRCFRSVTGLSKEELTRRELVRQV